MPARGHNQIPGGLKLDTSIVKFASKSWVFAVGTCCYQVVAPPVHTRSLVEQTTKHVSRTPAGRCT